jgi:hypothetical protein
MEAAMVRTTLLAWLQEDCGHECEVWSQTEPDGTWSLHFSCGCDYCNHLVRKVVNELYPDIPVTLVQ